MLKRIQTDLGDVYIHDDRVDKHIPNKDLIKPWIKIEIECLRRMGRLISTQETTETVIISQEVYAKDQGWVRLDELDTRLITQDVYDATIKEINSIHAKGIIHNDLAKKNPDNIMYNTNTGEVRIIDFGIAKLAGQKSPDFMPTKENKEQAIKTQYPTALQFRNFDDNQLQAIYNQINNTKDPIKLTLKSFFEDGYVDFGYDNLLTLEKQIGDQSAISNFMRRPEPTKEKDIMGINNAFIRLNPNIKLETAQSSQKTNTAQPRPWFLTRFWNFVKSKFFSPEIKTQLKPPQHAKASRINQRKTILKESLKTEKSSRDVGYNPRL